VSGAGGLPTPYYDRDGITIYHGDCREILPLLGRFDVLLTDPPYGHGKRWRGGTWARHEIYDAVYDWDAAPIEQPLLDACIAAADSSIVWGGNYYRLPPSRCWDCREILPTLGGA
jgi:hypothetical protein